jgi:transcription initiation factor TFIIIB Brf1 subunit/transcription initiation factor TFIIB
MENLVKRKKGNLTNVEIIDSIPPSIIDQSFIELENLVKKKKDVLTDVAIINTFPNALLLEESIFNSTKKSSKAKPIVKSEKTEDVWDILNQLKKENNSDAIDTITTDSETAVMSTASNDSENDERVCDDCKSKGTLIEDQKSGVTVCCECGFVNEEIIDHSPEWRQFNNEESRNDSVGRCGCPSNFFFPKLSQGTIMTGPSSNRIKRKQKWNSQIYKERSLNQVFDELNRVCTKYKIPNIARDDARIYYKIISDSKHNDGSNVGKNIIIRGTNRKGIIAACLFKACENNKIPRSIKEIAEYFKLNEKKITKGNKQLERIMRNSKNDEVLMIDHLRDTNIAEDYIRRHCPKLKINKNYTNVAVKISNNCCKMKLASDHNPQSVAAGAILLMVQYCELDVDKKDIASLFRTSDVTISKIYNKILPYAEALVDDEATDYLIEKFKING